MANKVVCEIGRATYSKHTGPLNCNTLVFAARCYMQARPMLSCGVCMSVCPSVVFVNSVETNEATTKCL